MFVGILIFLVFSKSGIHYLWEGEIRTCKILVPNKVAPVKSDYLFIKISNCIDINKWMGFCIGAVLPKQFSAYIS